MLPVWCVLAGLQNFDAELMTPQVVEKRVPYMTPEDEAIFREGLLQRLNDKLPDIPVNEKNHEFMECMRQVINRCFSLSSEPLARCSRFPVYDANLLVGKGLMPG